jgi:gluconate 2-dehydrogenase alpha chain
MSGARPIRRVRRADITRAAPAWAAIRGTSVVNRYGQSWDIPNLFVIGSSTFSSMSGFNPTLTIEALAYLSADAIVNRYRKSPGPLI